MALFLIPAVFIAAVLGTDSNRTQTVHREFSVSEALQQPIDAVGTIVVDRNEGSVQEALELAQLPVDLCGLVMRSFRGTRNGTFERIVASGKSHLCLFCIEISRQGNQVRINYSKTMSTVDVQANLRTVRTHTSTVMFISSTSTSSSTQARALSEAEVTLIRDRLSRMLSQQTATNDVCKIFIADATVHGNRSAVTDFLDQYEVSPRHFELYQGGEFSINERQTGRALAIEGTNIQNVGNSLQTKLDVVSVIFPSTASLDDIVHPRLLAKLQL